SGCLTQIQTLRIASTQTLIDAVTTALPTPSFSPLSPSDMRSERVPLLDLSEVKG
ncbi:hypothetical protein Tco_0665783, partial [Tanacetum coccineum]